MVHIFLPVKKAGPHRKVGGIASVGARGCSILTAEYRGIVTGQIQPNVARLMRTRLFLLYPYWDISFRSLQYAVFSSRNNNMPPVTKIFFPLRKQLFPIYPKAITCTVIEKATTPRLLSMLLLFLLLGYIRRWQDETYRTTCPRRHHIDCHKLIEFLDLIEIIEYKVTDFIPKTIDPIYVGTPFQHGLFIIMQEWHYFRSSNESVTTQSKFRSGSSSMGLMFSPDAILARSSYSYLHLRTPYPALTFLRIVP